MRKVVIEEDRLRQWLWFHWRTQAMPARVEVGRDPLGRVAIADASTGKILYRFVREFGQPRQIEEIVTTFFRHAGRLGHAA